MSSTSSSDTPSVATFYKFVDLTNLAQWQDQLSQLAEQAELRGTVLLAAEGINGTLVGNHKNVRLFVKQLRALAPFAETVVKFSSAAKDNRVFHRLKIKIKDEIVTLGVPNIRPQDKTGVHVGPQRWHELLDDPDVPVVDVRNLYETEIGTFTGSVNPGTESFREFPDFVASELDSATQPRVAMFCTGGIRCEKASAFLYAQGFKEVFQLEGGILQYLEQIDDDQSRWRGECFVFDQRVSVTEDLQQGQHVQCFACRRALTPTDTASEHYVHGESCAYCVNELSAQQRAGFAERQRQVDLAQSRGERHIGPKGATRPSTPDLGTHNGRE